MHHWEWVRSVVEAAIASGRLGEVRGFIGGLYGPDLHAKRVDALAAATLGVMTGASLAVAMIGQALAQARGLVTKHAVKQVDRLMSNAGIDVWDSFCRWVPQQLGERRNILVAMDWTDFDHDSQSTLVLSLVTGNGRAAPLIWLTVWNVNGGRIMILPQTWCRAVHHSAWSTRARRRANPARPYMVRLSILSRLI
jgi:hypothetical protein